MAHIEQRNIDEKFINLAINLAKKYSGNSAENPMVGCVIVCDNNILATATTSSSGRPHAEINAINKIIDKNILSKSTIYITLEPCCHFGKSSPCVDEIIKYKFKRVVFCSIDPNPLVNGKSIELLQRNNIEVIHGIKNLEAQKINQDFFKFITQKKPFITIKIASSLDGKIADRNYNSKWISNEKSRQFAHLLRAKNQAILVGANTLIHDDPSLNCRLAGLENNSPIQIVITKNLQFSFKEKFFNENFSQKKILICDDSHSQNNNLAIWQKKSANNQVIFFKNNQQNIDLKLVLQELFKLNIKSILVEGGSAIITQLISQNLVDQLILIRSTKIFGNQAIPAINNLKIDNIKDSIQNFSRVNFFAIDQDLVEIFNYVDGRDDEYKN